MAVGGIIITNTAQMDVLMENARYAPLEQSNVMEII